MVRLMFNLSQAHEGLLGDYFWLAEKKLLIHMLAMTYRVCTVGTEGNGNSNGLLHEH